MTGSGSGVDPSDTVLEISRLQVLARAAGVSFAFPLLLYGGAGIVSGLLLALVSSAGLSIWVYNSWWAMAALAAPVLIARHYGRRLGMRGVGISRNRAFRYAAGTELLAALLWFAYPLYPVRISAPWLGFAVGAVVVGGVWRDRALHVIALGVCVIVGLAAILPWPMAVTDVAVGTLLCGGAAHGSCRRKPRGGRTRRSGTRGR